MRKKVVLASSVSILMIIALLLTHTLSLAQPDTPWLDAAWRHRREVSISAPCGQEASDYQVQITLDSGFDFSKALSDGGDLRVTAADGTTELPFWIETWDAAAQQAVIWVQVPSIPTAGTTIYLYYGNAAATTASNGQATWVAYDGFEENDVGTIPTAPGPSSWTKYAGNPVMGCSRCGFASVFYDSDTGIYHSYSSWTSILHYTSTNGIDWTADADNPILTASQPWEGSNVGVPMVWKEDGVWNMLYRGGSPDRIGLATSPDGVNWTKSSENPVLQGDPGEWDDRDLDPWGVIKVGSTYYLWYNTISSIPGEGRATGLATSTDLTTWTKDPNNPIFTGGRFCAFPFRYDGDYYLLIPHYTSGTDYSQIELYRDTNPTFYPGEREYIGVAINYGPADWDDHDQDTPSVLTDDIYRDTFTAAGNQLWTYYAGEGGDGSWRTGMTIEEDIASALTGLEPGSLTWSASGDVTVVDSPVWQGVRSVRQRDADSSGADTLTGDFAPMEQGLVGAWMRRTSTSNGDYDIYLYGGSTLAVVGGLGRNGDFHYWNGSFQPTGVNWATDTWYLVTLAFDAATDQYDFVVYDETFSELVRVEDVGFGNATDSIDSAMLYTSSGYIGDGYADDFRVGEWCGAAAPTLVSGSAETQETQPVAGTGPITFDALDITLDVQVQGSLSSVQIVRTEEVHDHATPAFEPGYWFVRPNGDAAGYSVDMTFPHDGLSDPYLCRYTEADGWDCDRDTFDTSSVTRYGVSAFSDWAVGNDVPTVLQIRTLIARSKVRAVPALAGTSLFGLFLAGLILIRRRRG